MVEVKIIQTGNDKAGRLLVEYWVWADPTRREPNLKNIHVFDGPAFDDPNGLGPIERGGEWERKSDGVLVVAVGIPEKDQGLYVSETTDQFVIRMALGVWSRLVRLGKVARDRTLDYRAPFTDADFANPDKLGWRTSDLRLAEGKTFDEDRKEVARRA